jgi:hypothetical protein
MGTARDSPDRYPVYPGSALSGSKTIYSEIPSIKFGLNHNINLLLMGKLYLMACQSHPVFTAAD